MRTIVEMTHDDHQYNEWNKGEIGYIDGYCQAGQAGIYAAIVIEERVVFAASNLFKVKGLMTSSNSVTKVENIVNSKD